MPANLKHGFAMRALTSFIVLTLTALSTHAYWDIIYEDDFAGDAGSAANTEPMIEPEGFQQQVGEGTVLMDGDGNIHTDGAGTARYDVDLGSILTDDPSITDIKWDVTLGSPTPQEASNWFGLGFSETGTGSLTGSAEGGPWAAIYGHLSGGRVQLRGGPGTSNGSGTASTGLWDISEQQELQVSFQFNITEQTASVTINGTAVEFDNGQGGTTAEWPVVYGDGNIEPPVRWASMQWTAQLDPADGGAFVSYSRISVRYEKDERITLPYQQDFEGLQPGTPASGIPGWSSTGIDISGIIEKVYDFDHLPRPLPESGHTRVLDLKGSSVFASFKMENSSHDQIYLDKMVRLPASTANLIEYLTNMDDLKLALYLDDMNQLRLFHGGPTGNDAGFTTFEGIYEPDSWYRLTVSMNMSGQDSGNNTAFFRLYLDGEPLNGVSEGFNTPSTSEEYDGGPWFRFANHSEQLTNERHLKLNWIGFEGDILVDDFVVTGARPSTVLTRSIITRLHPEYGQGTMYPYGEWIGDAQWPSYEIKTEDGLPANITYSADQFYLIEKLESNNAEITDAAGRDIYIWGVDTVTDDIVNSITFAEKIWSNGDGGDGRSPMWWADARGYSHGTELSVYEGYLLNQENLDSPFRIIEFGLNDDNLPFVKWISSGQARGNIIVKTTDDLLTDRESWTNIQGTTEHDQGINTWTGSREADPQSFYHVEIEESLDD